MDNGSIRAFERCGTVVVEIYGYNGTMSSSAVELGTIPNGYRPATDITSTALCGGSLTNLAAIGVSTAGKVTALTGNGTTSYCRGSITYVI